MMKPTRFERLLAAFGAPRLAMARMRDRAAFQAFSGAGADGAALNSATNERWVTVARSANSDLVRGLKRQRAESRDLRRHNPIATGAFSTNINRVVGTGLQPVPAPAIEVLGWTENQAADWKAAWAREFSLWADSRECTLDGSATFYESQQLVLGARLESGDCFTLLPDGEPTDTMPYRLRLQTIEADRCGNPAGQMNTRTMVEGVDLTGGRPVRYHIFDEHPGDATVTTTSGRWYVAIGTSGRRRILHHFRPTRPEQARGVPYLTPVIQAIKDLGRYTEAEITAAVMSAFYTVFIEQDSSVPNPAAVFGADGTSQASLSGQQPAEGDVELGPGAVIGLGRGEKATIANPMRPNTAYEPFVMGVLTFIGVGLNLPREVLVKSFNASFSASKAALLDAMKHFMTERAWLVQSYCQPVYETILAEAVAAGRIAAPGFFRDPLVRWAYTRATWHGDSAGSLNPKDEVAAYTAAIDARLMTRERAAWELFGNDWTAAYPTIKREQEQLRADNLLPEPKAGAAASSNNPTPDATPTK